MIHPVIRHIESPDLVPPALPDDPEDCEVVFHAIIGPREAEGGEEFHFTVVTPNRLRRGPAAAWGRGLLVVQVFEWPLVIESVATLLASSVRPTWDEVVRDLDRELCWRTECPLTDAN